MSWSWGYSPKIEKRIPLDGFPPDKYLAIALHAIQSLGWNLSHLSESGIIAYTSFSWQSYGEEVSIRVISGYVLVKSECIGIQLLFNDYGKNEENLDKFFNEFEYREFHLKDSLGEELVLYNARAALQDDAYFERAPLAAKEKINSLFQLFTSRKGYFVTPILVQLNILYYILTTAFLSFSSFSRHAAKVTYDFSVAWNSIYHHLGVNNRHLTLSGDYWRLITSQFVHFSVMHIFFNMYALIYIGLMVENKVGSIRFLLTYIFSGIAAATVSILFHPTGNIGGASGAIMAMFGCFLALLASHDFEKSARKALLISTVLVVSLMLLSGLQGNADNSSHVAGLISGFAITRMGQFLHQRFRMEGVWLNLLSILPVLIFTAIVLSSTPNYQVEKLSELSYSYRRNEHNAGRVYFYDYYFKNGDKSDRLARISRLGIANWRRNVLIATEMKSLTLSERDKRRAERMSQYAEKMLRMYQLLYRESEENTGKYRVEIERLTDEVNAIRETERKDTGRGWGRVFSNQVFSIDL